MITVAAKALNVNAMSTVDHELNELGFRHCAPQLNAFGISVGNEGTGYGHELCEAEVHINFSSSW